MTYDDYLSLTSEIRQLQAILAEIPPQNEIDRLGFEARLEGAQALVANANESQLVHKARLIFRGKPVLGTHGIAVDFAAKAAGAFSDAISAIAAGLSESFGYMGPIPDKQKNQLLITGIAVGSFGFELEIPPPEKGDLFQEPCKTEMALIKMEQLLRLSAGGSDDEVADLIEEVHPRAVRKAAEFLDFIAQQEAFCGIEFKEQVFKFVDTEQVRTSACRLREDNIHEEDVTFPGEFQGVLPSSRTFEFKIAPNNTVIRGKVGFEIENADQINLEFLHHAVRATFQKIQVGQGRPRYSINRIENISLGLG